MVEILVMNINNPLGHFAQLGIRNILDLQQYLQKIFEESDHQDIVIAKLYKMVFPDWEKIKRIEGYPIIGQGLWGYICNLSIEFDRKNHPGCFNGGAWVNNGFASSDCLDPWMISLENCKVIYS